MTKSTATLAKAITRSASKQSYYTFCLMADRALVYDAYGVYAYFRWVDDFIDVAAKAQSERISFVQRQKDIMERSYRNERLSDLTEEEKILTELIANDRGERSSLGSYIRNMLAVMEFDAHRKGRLISYEELAWYSDCLGVAVMDALCYLIGNRCSYPRIRERYLAVVAAHITHMLRDTVEDTTAGYINIPRQYLEANRIDPEDIHSPPYRAWVRQRVDLARRYFEAGKRYIDGAENLRFRIACNWYCTRFEGVLDTIEGDGYFLRSQYPKPKAISAWLRMGYLGLSVALRHLPQTQIKPVGQVDHFWN